MRRLRSFNSNISAKQMNLFRVLFLALPIYAAQLTIYVDAPGIDYRSVQALTRSLRHSNWGHAWIRLDGPDGTIEGGHSGEITSRYVDEIADLALHGDPNPIRLLFEERNDGFFQEGSGGHQPTFATHIELSEEQYNAIRAFISDYDFSRYSLADRQCTTFVVEVARLAGVELDAEVTVPITKRVRVGRAILPLRTDERYAKLRLALPERLARAPLQPCPYCGSPCQRRLSPP